MATMQLSPQMAADYARLCTFFQDMKDELQGAVEKAGEGGEKGNSPMKVYWSLQQRCVRVNVWRWCSHHVHSHLTTFPPTQNTKASSGTCSTASR